MTSRVKRARDWFKSRPVAADSLLAFAVWLFMGIPLTLVTVQFTDANLAWALLMTTLGIATVAMRRRWMWPGAIVLSVVSVIAVASISDWSAPESFAFLIYTYTAAAHRRFLSAVWLSLVVWVPSTALHLVVNPPEEHALLLISISAALTWVLLSTTFFIGWIAQNRRIRLQELLERAEAAEANQRALVAQSVADERRRIARELHDVVAHHVAAMGVMASGAKRILGSDPEQAREAMEIISETSRTAMQEMRTILEVLRTDTDESELDPEMTPQPGVESLQALVSQARHAGLPVKFTVKGVPFAPAEGVGLAIYRIVQEALTNTIKHGGRRARAGIVVTYGTDDVTVEIADTGHGNGALDGTLGHGLVGIRERVSLYGGSLWVGPRPGGGFQVRATFPSSPHLTPTSAEMRKDASS